MIGVETLPEKKKSEYWKFDEGVYPDSSKPLLIAQPTFDYLQFTRLMPKTSSASRLM